MSVSDKREPDAGLAASERTVVTGSAADRLLAVQNDALNVALNDALNDVRNASAQTQWRCVAGQLQVAAADGLVVGV